MLTRDRLNGEYIVFLRCSRKRKNVAKYFSMDHRIFDGRLIILKRVISKIRKIVFCSVGVPLNVVAT